MSKISELVCAPREEAITPTPGLVLKHRDGALRIFVGLHGMPTALPIRRNNGKYYLELTTATSVPGYVYKKTGMARTWNDRLTGVGVIELKKYWVAFGEDPNCDYGGSHSNPFLGVYHGRYSLVKKVVASHPKWITWGGGGYINEVQVIEVEDDA